MLICPTHVKKWIPQQKEITVETEEFEEQTEVGQSDDVKKDFNVIALERT
jgi:hypothetical protein